MAHRRDKGRNMNLKTGTLSGSIALYSKKQPRVRVRVLS